MESKLLELNCYGNEKQYQCAQLGNPKVSEIVYGGAKGGAKSYTGCALIFGTAFYYPETHWFIARQELNDLRKFTIPSIYEVFNDYKITPNYYNYNGQDSVFTLYNKSKIFLLNAKLVPTDPLFQRFGSMQNTGGWIEEGGEFCKAAKTALRISCGRWKNDIYNLPLKLLITCNPSKNFLYNDYYKKNKEGLLEPDKVFIQAFVHDNKKLPAGYIQNLENELTGSERQRLLLGNWEYDDDPATLIPYDKILDMFTNLHVRKEDAQRYITADVARMGSDKAVIAAWRGFEVVELKEFNTCTTTQLETAITDMQLKYRVSKSNTIADEDGVGGGVVDHLGIKGFINNSKAHGGENYQNLKTQCYYNYAKRVNKGEVYVSAELTAQQREVIIQEHEQIKSYKTDTDGKLRILPKEDVKQNIGHSPDYTDTFMMRERFALAYTGPIPMWI